MKQKKLKQKLKFLFIENLKSKLFFSEKGIALITTLIMVTLLAGWALNVNHSVRTVVMESSGLKSGFILYNRAEAGIFIAERILINDRKFSKTDSVQELWSDETKIKKYLNNLGYADNELKIKITDVLSKIQVNALVSFPNKKNLNQVKLWERFLDGMRIEYPELIQNPYDLINPLLDWLDYNDGDTVTGLSGAETIYYESNKKTLPRNGPVKSIEELSLIKGMTEKVWNKVYNSGIAQRYFTVDGDVTRSGRSFNYSGKININTAPVEIVAALIKDSSFYPMAEEICNFREEKSEGKYLYDLTGKWYKKCPGCENIPFDESILTTSSDIFIIESSASDEDMKISIECIVKRVKNKSGKWDIKILKWESNQI